MCELLNSTWKIGPFTPKYSVNESSHSNNEDVLTFISQELIEKSELKVLNNWNCENQG